MYNGNIGREEREKETEEKIEPIMMEDFTKLMSDAKPRIQEAQRTPIRINARKTTYTLIIFKL